MKPSSEIGWPIYLNLDSTFSRSLTESFIFWSRTFIIDTSKNTMQNALKTSKNLDPPLSHSIGLPTLSHSILNGFCLVQSYQPLPSHR